jgi:hypothetical protein
MLKTLRAAGFVLVGLIGVAAVGTVADAQSDGAPYRPLTTLAELMETVVMPAADVLWSAVAVDVTAEGTKTTQPETDEDWLRVRGAANDLIEIANALMVPGRRVDMPGVVSEAPESELGPDEIQKRIDAHPEIWIGFAHGLQDATMQSIKAIDAKDVDALSDAGGTLDMACENCHTYFWYPENIEQIRSND